MRLSVKSIDFILYSRTSLFICTHIVQYEELEKLSIVRVLFFMVIANYDANCRTHVSLAYCRCSCACKEKERKENPSCTIIRWHFSCVPFLLVAVLVIRVRQFFCRRTCENSESKKLSRRHQPRNAKDGNRAEINANPSNLSSAMTKGRRWRAMDHEKKMAKSVGRVWKGKKGRSRLFFARRFQLGPISFSRCSILFSRSPSRSSLWIYRCYPSFLPTKSTRFFKFRSAYIFILYNSIFNLTNIKFFDLILWL